MTQYSFIQSPNFDLGRKLPISIIVIHFTGSGSLESAVKWFQNPSHGLSAHYVIGQDGHVVQMVLESDKARHAGQASFMGDPNVNTRSIGIELVNWGDLEKHGEQFTCWPDHYTRPYDRAKYGEPRQANGKWWAPYHTLQTVACSKLCSEIIKRYPLITPERIVGHEHVAPGRKNDPGPLFDMLSLRKTAFNSKANSIIGEPKPSDEIGDDQLYKSQSDRAGD